MKKSINVDKSFNDMRIDRFIRNHLGKIPQGLIEKNLRNGRLKLILHYILLNRFYKPFLI